MCKAPPWSDQALFSGALCNQTLLIDLETNEGNGVLRGISISLKITSSYEVIKCSPGKAGSASCDGRRNYFCWQESFIGFWIWGVRELNHLQPPKYLHFIPKCSSFSFSAPVQTVNTTYIAIILQITNPHNQFYPSFILW